MDAKVPEFLARTRSTTVITLALFAIPSGLLGCGGGGGGDGDGGGGDTGPEAPLDGTQCGGLLGFKTDCWVDQASLQLGTSPDINQATTIPNIIAPEVFGKVCCQGLAPQAEADGTCVEACMRKVCEAAQSNHLDLAAGIEGVHICLDGATCGFSMSDCLSGEFREQKIKFLVSSASYFLRATCMGARTNETFSDDVFDWHELPIDDPSNDPNMCIQPIDFGGDPDVVFADDSAIEDAGTVATVSWQAGSASGSASSEDISVELEYDVHDCATNAKCLDLARLSLDLPSITVSGISLARANLTVYEVTQTPAIGASGGFVFGAGALRVVVSGVADGVPIVVAGSNADSAPGQLSPAADTLTLSGLRFDYQDSMISAELFVDIVGDYTRRAPTAVVAPLYVPRSCSQAVVFRAASSDLDGGSLLHTWWVPGLMVASGSTLSVVLPAGRHKIGLISKDATGRMDATAITYTRTCT